MKGLPMTNATLTDVEVMASDLQELVSAEESEWLNSLPPEELARYGGHYIAVRKHQIVAADRSLGKLYQKLERQGLKYRVRVRYIEEPDAMVIY
jgi:hypothetical protein